MRACVNDVVGINFPYIYILFFRDNNVDDSLWGRDLLPRVLEIRD